MMQGIYYNSICVSVIFLIASSCGMYQDVCTGNTTDTFLYFAYGSNLLKERLTLKNPSAVFVSTGKLTNFTLLFGHWTGDFTGNNSWHGAVATIEERPGKDVWGVVWRLDMKNLVTLDKQEGVERGIYRPINVTVVTSGGQLLCRSYQMNNFKEYLTSAPYMEVVLWGAKQNNLPEDYIRQLEAVKTNEYKGSSILDDIRSHFNKSSGSHAEEI